MTASSINGLIAAAVLAAILVYFAYHCFVFWKDICFYRRANWDLSLDSWNRIFLLNTLRHAASFRRHPVGYHRLLIGYQHFAFVILVGVGLLHQLLSEPTGNGMPPVLDKKTSFLIYFGLGFGYFLLSWIFEFWLHRKVGWNLPRSAWIETYIGSEQFNKLSVSVKYILIMVLLLAMMYVHFPPD